jgi:hypothetical protein
MATSGIEGIYVETRKDGAAARQASLSVSLQSPLLAGMPTPPVSGRSTDHA